MTMAEKGLTHVYYGYGKGKTTAAIGLALRASGCGKKVVIVQFLKKTQSGELSQFTKLSGITVLRGTATAKFSSEMSPAEKEDTARTHNANLKQAMDLVASGQCDLLILDEALDAYQLGMLDKTLFAAMVKDKSDLLELVVTGHEPVDWVLEGADYITEMVNHKHPFDAGIKARRGIEY